MRALLISHLFLPHVGGVENVVHYEIEALVEAGHEVVLLTSDGSGAATTPDYPTSVEVVRIPAWHFIEQHFQLPYPVFSLRLLPRLYHELGRCDVVHIHGFMFHCSVLAALLGRARGTPIILTDHGGIQDFESKLKSKLAWLGAHTVGRTTALCSDRLVAYNQRVADLLERLAHREGQALFVPNPVDPSLFRHVSPKLRAAARLRLGWNAHRTIVLFVGRLTAEKGVPLLLDCVQPERYDLVFCASGDRSMLGSLPRPGVSFLPPRPHAALADLYHAADLLVVPSRAREGFPAVVQEGLRCGMKVVLGYDPGFEPYRALPGLSFCQATANGVQEAIDEALTTRMPPELSAEQAELCPRPADWIRHLYQGMPGFVEST